MSASKTPYKDFADFIKFNVNTGFMDDFFNSKIAEVAEIFEVGLPSEKVKYVRTEKINNDSWQRIFRMVFSIGDKKEYFSFCFLLTPFYIQIGNAEKFCYYTKDSSLIKYIQYRVIDNLRNAFLKKKDPSFDYPDPSIPPSFRTALYDDHIYENLVRHILLYIKSEFPASRKMEFVDESFVKEQTFIRFFRGDYLFELELKEPESSIAYELELIAKLVIGQVSDSTDLQYRQIKKEVLPRSSPNQGSLKVQLGDFIGDLDKIAHKLEIENLPISKKIGPTNSKKIYSVYFSYVDSVNGPINRSHVVFEACGKVDAFKAFRRYLKNYQKKKWGDWQATYIGFSEIEPSIIDDDGQLLTKVQSFASLDGKQLMGMSNQAIENFCREYSTP